MGDVVKWGGVTTIPEKPEDTLEKAKGWDLERVVIVGHNKDGELAWGGSFSEVEIIHWLLSCAIKELMDEV